MSNWHTVLPRSSAHDFPPSAVVPVQGDGRVPRRNADAGNLAIREPMELRFRQPVDEAGSEGGGDLGVAPSRERGEVARHPAANRDASCKIMDRPVRAEPGPPTCLTASA